MKKNKYMILFLATVMYYIISNCIYSCDFNFIVETIQIPRFNVKGEELNHEIYDKYGVFVYSDPLEVQKMNNSQRFKEVKDKGKYLYNGIKGEFFILGTNYDGKYVYNVNFPVDFVPESLPETWNFIYYKDFEDSWNSNYKYEEQLKYMKNTNLLFDKIDLINKTCDSYDLVEYNVSPIKIGIGKFRLNTPATWKTMGIITAKRRLNNGLIRDVVFATKPMSADADVQSYVNIVNQIDINEDEDNNNFYIEYGAKAINLSQYANSEHIKKIKAEIYINDQYIDSISGSKTTEVDKKINYVVSREDNEFSAKEFVLKVEVKSYLYTEFLVDGLMNNSKVKEILVKIAPKKLVPVKYIELNLLKNKNESLVISPLVQTNQTKKFETLGFIEEGRRLAISIALNVNCEYIDDISIHINNIKSEYKVIRSYENLLIIEPNMEGSLYVSIAGWSTLRNYYDSYLESIEESIGERIKSPNVLDISIKLIFSPKEYKYICLFDVFDNFLNNINYKFSRGILNYEEISNECQI